MAASCPTKCPLLFVFVVSQEKFPRIFIETNFSVFSCVELTFSPEPLLKLTRNLKIFEKKSYVLGSFIHPAASIMLQFFFNFQLMTSACVVYYVDYYSIYLWCGIESFYKKKEKKIDNFNKFKNFNIKKFVKSTLHYETGWCRKKQQWQEKFEAKKNKKLIYYKYIYSNNISAL